MSEGNRSEASRRATRRYMSREVGKPWSDICTLCGRKREQIGKLIACRSCDAMPLLNQGLEPGT